MTLLAAFPLSNHDVAVLGFWGNLALFLSLSVPALALMAWLFEAFDNHVATPYVKRLVKKDDERKKRKAR